MIRFPETVQKEWDHAALAVEAAAALKARIERDTLVERKLEDLRIRHQAEVQFQAELAAENTPALDMMTLAEYKANPAMAGPGDLIEGAMKDEGLCLMLGPSGSGKSTLALQALHSLMTGTSFLGQPVQQIAGSVGVLSYDMSGSLVMDWMSGFPGVDDHKISVVNAYKQGNPLAVPAHREAIANLWKAMKVEVVVVDSFSASFFGRDQNDAAEAMSHYRDLKAFALTECGARAVIVIVHSTESSPTKPRGSTVHQDVADSIVSCWVPNKAQGDPSRHVDITKYRQHRTAAGTMSHQMDPVVISAPDDITHLVALDAAGMMLAGHTLPQGTSVDDAFPDLPEGFAVADTDSSFDSEEDDL